MHKIVYRSAVSPRASSPGGRFFRRLQMSVGSSEPFCVPVPVLSADSACAFCLVWVLSCARTVTSDRVCRPCRALFRSESWGSCRAPRGWLAVGGWLWLASVRCWLREGGSRRVYKEEWILNRPTLLTPMANMARSSFTPWARLLSLALLTLHTRLHK